MSQQGRREWVRARHTPANGTRVTVSLQEGNVSVAWTVKRFQGEPLKAAVKEARRYAEEALAELQEATNQPEEREEGAA